MPEQLKDYSKIWSELSRETQEICQLIGTAPTGLNNFELMVGEHESKVVLTELKERGLILERTYRQELEEQAKMISDDRKKEMTSLSGPIPALTKYEKNALDAIRSLKEQSEGSLNSMRLQLDRNFGKFVDSLESKENKDKDMEVVELLPDELILVTARQYGEPEDTQNALSMIEQGKKLQSEFESMKQEDLENEYKRIYSDFDLAMRYDDKLRAILNVLFDKYNLEEKDLARLRQ